MNNNKIKKIHFVGIKGVGMTPLAIIAKEAGFTVTGSDSPDIFITDSALTIARITPFTEFSKGHIQDVDLVITTGAHGGYDNIEVVAAKEKGIRVISQGEAVGLFMKGEILGTLYKGISVAGSHGKTTTSAMIATLLSENKKDPSYVVGTSELIPLGLPGHFGKGDYFIAESDEYATEPVHDKTPKLLWQYPQIAIFTNIELDHPDLYASVDEVRNVFLTFANRLPKDGLLIACGDDYEIQKLLPDYSGHLITYGFSPQNNYAITRVTQSDDQIFFWLSAHGSPLGEWRIPLMGEHNVLNAVATIIVGLETGIPLETIRKTVSVFKGSRRRSEYVGNLLTGAKVYDDYAHHPTEIRKTLGAFRARFPKKKLICVFQPHTYSRTKILFDEFARSFLAVDTVIVIDIYSSKREAVDTTISSEKLVGAMHTHHKEAIFLPTIQDVVEYLDTKHVKDDSVVITMGAGDIYSLRDFLTFEE